VTRYRWVAARKAEGFPITAACKVAEVSTTAFDDWRRREAAGSTDAERAEAALVAAIREIHDETDGTYGEPRMTPELRDRGWAVNHKRVERLMRLHGIVGVHRPPRVRTTIPAEYAPPLPDLVGRRFDPGRPMSPGSATSPTSPPRRAGCIWPRSSISGRGAGWATRWPTTCAPNSSPTRCAWPPAHGRCHRGDHLPR
jgi:transposase InsO family protein